MEDNPSSFKQCGDDCPVASVSWKDAQRFIEEFNQLEKTRAYRLPSEAEWEYMPAGRERHPNIYLETMPEDLATMPGILEIPIIRLSGPQARTPIPGVCTTCTATYGNGWKTTITTAIGGRRLTAGLGWITLEVPTA